MITHQDKIEMFRGTKRYDSATATVSSRQLEGQSPTATVGSRPPELAKPSDNTTTPKVVAAGKGKGSSNLRK